MHLSRCIAHPYHHLPELHRALDNGLLEIFIRVILRHSEVELRHSWCINGSNTNEILRHRYNGEIP